MKLNVAVNDPRNSAPVPLSSIVRKMRVPASANGDEMLYRAALDLAAEAVVIARDDGTIIDANMAACALASYSRAELVGRPLGALWPTVSLLDSRLPASGRAASGSPSAATIVSLQCADGRELLVELAIQRVARPDAAHFIIVARACVAESQREAPLHGAAMRDFLTQLPNRQVFQSRLDRAMARATKRPDYRFGVLFVDLDRFKRINDAFGHLAGDQVLITIAQRLAASVRPQDMVARRDGDEFTILVDDLDKPYDALRVAVRIHRQLQTPILIDQGTELVPRGLTASASIGIAFNSVDLQSADDIIAYADAAMYRAKSQGGGTHTIWSSVLPKLAPRARRPRHAP